MAPRKKPPPLPPGTRTYYNISVYRDPSGEWIADMPGDGKTAGILLRAETAFDVYSKMAAFGIQQT
jgi:hypothetical protein